MNKKTFITFLLAFALGGAAYSYFFNQSPALKEAPQSTARQQQKRPDWMAPPGSERPLVTSGDAEAQPEAQPVEKERRLKIGVIGPESGEEAFYGKAILRGIMMAAERLKADGGIGGKEIEVIHADNQGGDQETRDIFNNMVNQGVVAIFTAPTGWSTFAPTHLANSSRTILVSVGARRHIGRSGDYVFQFSLPDKVAINDLMNFSVNNLGYKDYALVTSSSYDYSLDISSLFKQALAGIGGKILVDADTYDTFTGKKNIAAVVKAIKNAPQLVQAVIFTGGAEEAAILARAMAASGLKLPIIGDEDLFDEVFLKNGGAAVSGALMYTTFSVDSLTSEVSRFMKMYARDQGGVPGRFSALAYDAFAFLAASINVSGSLKSTDVRQAMLDNKGIQGVTGATRLTPYGVAIKHPFIYQVESSADGEKFTLLHTGK